MSHSKCITVSAAFLSFIFSIASLPAIAQQTLPDPTPSLDALEQTARGAATDLGHIRVEKWKIDNKSRYDAQTDRDSLQRNLQSLPEVIGKVRQAPNDLTANFELYRNLEVLSGIFSHFAETTGAFGSHDDYSMLANDLSGLDKARRDFTQRMETLTSSAQAELTRYRTQAKSTQAATSAQPKKIVIDDSEPDKKSAAAKKKKPAAKPADTNTNSNANTPQQ